MSDDLRREDDAFGKRLGRVLRAPEQFDDTFEDDLVAAIRADRPGEREPAHRVRPHGPISAWWRTPVTVRFSPMTALAVAASLAAVTLGFLVSSSRPVAPSVAVTRVVHDTVHVVRFVFVGDAKTVSLVGDFNAWGAKPTPLRASGANGSWAVSVALSRGRHEYAFIVDGKRWVADPYAPATSDEFNTSSSIVTVGT